MKAVVQRVSSARVSVEGVETGAIGPGLLVFVGMAPTDTSLQAENLARRITNARIFVDEHGRMNRSLLDVRGSVLAISQFTLLGDTSQRRPFFGGAMAPQPASLLYDAFCSAIRDEKLVCETGRFGAHMLVESTNDGPVTLLYDEL